MPVFPLVHFPPKTLLYRYMIKKLSEKIGKDAYHHRVNGKKKKKKLVLLVKDDLILLTNPFLSGKKYFYITRV